MASFRMAVSLHHRADMSNRRIYSKRSGKSSSGASCLSRCSMTLTVKCIYVYCPLRTLAHGRPADRVHPQVAIPLKCNVAGQSTSHAYENRADL
ncbi:hypothetical protein NPIL_474881 [Nephila pilipes]|uniref:Uncharacterized protein n=1 Tax=Nephila pilipes TaxID=299642 RepID=A0A8X6N080_NEPPI|nr:hypothetical protein NPIL_474881 [Nephila pilipes]